jgi:hypothetical protein
MALSILPADWAASPLPLVGEVLVAAEVLVVDVLGEELPHAATSSPIAGSSAKPATLLHERGPRQLTSSALVIDGLITSRSCFGISRPWSSCREAAQLAAVAAIPRNTIIARLSLVVSRAAALRNGARPTVGLPREARCCDVRHPDLDWAQTQCALDSGSTA